MSSLLLPASFLKPDRSWDARRAGGARHRPRWWRHLLGGRSGLRFGPGSCCGCSQPCQLCCFECDFGTSYPSVTVTDDAGSTTCNWNGGGWRGCTTVSVPGDAWNTDPCGCNLAGTHTTGGSVAVVYSITCCDTATICVDRGWGICHAFCAYCTDTFDAGCNVQNAICPPADNPWTCSGPDGAQTYANDVGQAGFTSCKPFPLSFAMHLGTPCTKAGGGLLTSPMGPDLMVQA